MNGLGFKRGALIVFEGCDKAGKSTQCRKIVEKLWELGHTAQLMTFPDRGTATGRIINNYLGEKEELPDQAIHLLFSANRWESEPKMRQLLNEGVTLVVDRYSFSGVAYSAAKQKMTQDWCMHPEKGLPKPDLVFLLTLGREAAIARSGYGEERYEAAEFQDGVYKNFMLLKDDTWKIIDADKDIETLHEELLKDVEEVIKKVQNSQIKTLWS